MNVTMLKPSSSEDSLPKYDDEAKALKFFNVCKYYNPGITINLF